MMVEPTLVQDAWVLAEGHLSEPLPRRWKHSQAVAIKAQHAGMQILPSMDERAIVSAAALLHDIGYAPDIVDTGFHPLDGARWLRRRGFNERIVGLVAHHTCATYEAEERGLKTELVNEFVNEESPLTDILWYSDLTTGPNGESFTIEARLSEIATRYGPNDPVTRYIKKARGLMIRTVRKVERQITTTPYPM